MERKTSFDKINGYIIEYVKGHPLFTGRSWVGQHRVVMAEHLNRELLSTEIVHRTRKPVSA